jgi:signal peptidase II
MKKYWHIPLSIDLWIGLIIADQMSKAVAAEKLKEPFEFIKDFARFQYAENTGIAFSINVPPTQLIILNIILLLGVIFLAVKELDFKQPASGFLTATILAGAIGNMIDRIRLGYVIDFISIWKYPIFNLADAYIVIGVLGLIIFYGRIKKGGIPEETSPFPQ